MSPIITAWRRLECSSPLHGSSCWTGESLIPDLSGAALLWLRLKEGPACRRHGFSAGFSDAVVDIAELLKLVNLKTRVFAMAERIFFGTFGWIAAKMRP